MRSLLAMAIVLLVGLPGEAASCDHPDRAETFRASVIERTNVRRDDAGLPSLSQSVALTRAAQDHACWIAGTGTFSHSGAGGSTVGQRVTAEGYRWAFVAENIAQGQPDAPSVMRSWMSSKGHRRNILAAKARDIGVGVALARGRTIWVMVLGAPF